MEYVIGIVLITMAVVVAYLLGRVEALKAEIRNRPPQKQKPAQPLS
jgi:hypothetical protein